MIGTPEAYIHPEIRVWGVPTLELTFEGNEPFSMDFSLEKTGELAYAVLTVMAAVDAGSELSHTVKLVDGGHITFKNERAVKTMKMFIVEAEKAGHKIRFELERKGVDELCDAVHLAYNLLMKYDEDDSLDPNDAGREYTGLRALKAI